MTTARDHLLAAIQSNYEVGGRLQLIDFGTGRAGFTFDELNLDRPKITRKHLCVAVDHGLLAKQIKVVGVGLPQVYSLSPQPPQP